MYFSMLDTRFVQLFASAATTRMRKGKELQKRGIFEIFYSNIIGRIIAFLLN